MPLFSPGENGKARKANDPRVRKPPLILKTHLRAEGWVVFFYLPKLSSLRTYFRFAHERGRGCKHHSWQQRRNGVRNFYLSFLLILLLFLIPVQSYTQENSGQKQGEEQKLELQHKQNFQHSITVTANRVETPEKEVASSISVITREELDRMKKNSVLEALEEIVGLAASQNGPPGSPASIFIRGSNSEHTKVLLDGIELNNPITPGRSFDLSHFLIESIDRIEIIRGPQSTLYGSDAMGGVINIISRRKQGKPQLRAATSAGSYNTLSARAEIFGGTPKIAYSLGASHFSTEGYSAAGSQYEGNQEKDGYRNLSLSGKLDVHIHDNLDLDISIRTIRARTDLDVFGGDFGDDPNNRVDYTALFFKTGARGMFLQNRWESRINLAVVDYSRKFEDPTDDTHPFDSNNSEYLSRLLKLDWQNNFFLHETNTFTLGIEHLREQGESKYFSESAWGQYNDFFPIQKARNTGCFVQDRIRIAGRFFATLGIRFDHHSYGGDALTYRLAPGYYFELTGTRIKASLGTGFKSPSLYQLNAPPSTFGPIGNKDLKPEKCTGWDVGIEQNLGSGKLLAGAEYFSNKYTNLIDYDWTQGYINIGEASTRGFEFSLKAYPAESLLLSAAYTRTRAKDDISGERLLRRPREKLAATASFRFIKKANLILSYLYVGKRDDIIYAGWTPTRIIMAGYSLLNLVIAYDWHADLQLFLRLDNLLNEDYEVIKGYGTPGFSAYLGLQLHF